MLTREENDDCMFEIMPWCAYCKKYIEVRISDSQETVDYKCEHCGKINKVESEMTYKTSKKGVNEQ
ncbi:hypothetical protein LCGC14_1248690 [marine sediment metagenome]|uniref:Uncharacterized protein n=1 Tax=marine sediment metagenome TaxID=412755 RepID=A0A0F9LQP3_9ZZZZ